MQPGTVPEDIDSILSRFHTWAEKQQATNGNGSAHRNGNVADGPTSSEEVREIPYEEAIRRHRSRRAVQTPAAKPAVKKKAAARQAAVPATPAVPTGAAALPGKEKPPFVPSLELLAALRNAAAVPAPRGVAPQAQVQPIVFREDTDSGAEVTAESVALPLTKPSAATSAHAEAPPAKGASAKAAVAAPSRPPALKAPATPSKSAPPPGFHELLTGEAARTAATAGIPENPKTESRRPRPQKASPAAAKPGSIRAGTSGLAGRLPAKSVRAVPPMLRGTAAIPRTRTKAAKTPAPAKAGSSRAIRPRKPRHPPFHQVLTTTVQQPRIPDLPRKKGVPDRTRRITTRFTVTEERRIEKQASLLGLTVSAYLRHCALATVAPAAEPAPPSTRLAPRTPSTRESARSYNPQNPYAAQGSSLIGGWLALLRNRFLGPPIQFSDDA